MVPILTAEMSNTKSTKLCMLFVFVSEVLFDCERYCFGKSRPKKLVRTIIASKSKVGVFILFQAFLGHHDIFFQIILERD